MAMTLGRVNAFEEDTDEQLDFEEEDFSEFSHPKGAESNALHQKLGEMRAGKSYHDEDSTSGLDASVGSADEGELKSEEETDVSDDKSSEEGEVSSELEEMELAGDHSPTKEETPWERGLRLARERLERVKLLKATEKDLAEKRMNLEVPASAVDDELEKTVKEDVFWPCYYQALIIGRTELTGHRFLPEDLLPPKASETADWRRGLDSGRHGRRQRRYRRATSPSGSSSVSTSSRASSVVSSSVSSTVSSLASVAASWKATCAKAMKDYLNSPLGAKGRRSHRDRYHHGRRRHGPRSHSSRSSGSSSRSSDSRSLSDFSRDRAPRATAYGHVLTAATGAKLASQGVRRMWPDEAPRRTGGRVRSGSNRSSSRSGSRSSQDSSDEGRRRGWKYDQRGRRKAGGMRENSDQRSSSRGSDRERREVPPLPHERPVKRPWVAAPSLATATTTLAPTRHRSRSSSHSRSASPPPVDEKRFITSWSRSPSSGDERRGARDLVRRERLPDVVPGSHRGLRGATPGRKKKSRSPFALTNNAPSNIADHFPLETNNHLPGFPSAPQPPGSSQALAAGVTYGVPSSLPAASEPLTSASVPVPGPERSDATGRLPPRSVEQPANDTDVTAPSHTGGELPSASNRPGVRLTLAPRLKASAVNIASLTGATSRSSTNRPFQPSPPPQSRPPRLPFPPSRTDRGMSPGATGSSATPGTTAPLTAEQIRIQAEAAAAIVEARERRRAAAEAARRHRNPNRRKHDDLSKIPIRGRPTYRRQSFSSSSSSSSAGSSRSRSSAGAAASSAHSKSASRSRSTSPQTPDSRCDDPYGLSNRPDYQPPRGRRGAVRRGGGAAQGYGRDEFRDQSGEYFGNYGRPMQGPPQHQFQSQSRDFPIDGSRMRKRGDEYGRSDRGAAPYNRHKGGYETGDRHRMSYKSQPMKDMLDYAGADEATDMYSAPPFRHQGDLKVSVPNRGRYGSTMYEDSNQQRYPASSRRVVSQAPGERLARPRTPHADFDEPLIDRRSPRLSTNMDHRLRNMNRSHPMRTDDRDLDTNLGAPSRKRACIVAPDTPDESMAPTVIDPTVRRARTRHRSRGPGGTGAPIDRSEPFESDAGSYAAEQRLRELRERLNLVDDAIAEIKAGSAR